MSMTKQEAVQAYGTQQALAEALGIQRTAVTMWADDKPIPEKHELKLRYVLKPELFGPASPHPDTAAA